MPRERIRSEHDAPAPRTVRGQMKRDQVVFELLFGGNDIRTMKYAFGEQIREAKSMPNYSFTRDDMDCIIDLQRLWDLGTFRHIPEVVASRLFKAAGKNKLLDVDALRNPKLNNSGWSNRMLASMGLEMLRLYLMGVDPYMRRVIRNVLTANGKQLNMRRLLHGVNHSAEVYATDLEYDYDDDDFEFSSLENEEY